MASIEQDTAEWMEEEETYVVLNEPGSVFLQDPLKLQEPSPHVKQDVELKLDMDGSERTVQVYPSSMNIKQEMDDGVNQKFLADPLRIEDPRLHIKEDPELNLDVDGSDHNFVKSALEITWVADFIKEVPKRASEVDETESVVVASRSYASNSTRLLQNSGMCDFTFESTVRQGMSHSELETFSEESTHTVIVYEGEEEEKDEETISAPRLKCSLRKNKCQIFSCSFCLRSFSSKYRLMIHVFVHIDGVQPPKFVCKSCGEVFPSYVSLQKHLKFGDAGQDSSAYKEEAFYCSGEHGSISLQDDQEDSGMDQTGRQCSSYETWKSFTDKYNTLITGHNAEIRYRNDNNGSFDITGKVDAHTVPHLGKRSHKCDVCEKSFTQICNLRIHALIHTGTRPHQCEICGKCFSQSGNLKNHALIHVGIKPHKCDICGKSFREFGSLKRHSLLHTGMKLHKCDICGKSFTLSGHLKRHSLTHTGMKPYKCDKCGKSFTELGSLKRHSLLHTGTEPHKCHICGKSFTKLWSVKRHSLIHTGTQRHKCAFCGKYFTELGSLKSHSLLHTGKELHKCHICGKSFTELRSVKRHSLIHTGTQRHKCDICGKSFTNLSDVKRHKVIHTRR